MLVTAGVDSVNSGNGRVLWAQGGFVVILVQLPNEEGYMDVLCY